MYCISCFFLIHELNTEAHWKQPDSPAELGGKIYEMMAMALGGRWGRFEEEETEASEETSIESDASSAEVVEPQVVEPSE